MLERLSSQGDPVGPKSVEVIYAGLEEYQKAKQMARQNGETAPEFSKNAENAFIRLSRGVNNFVIFKEIGLYYMRDLEMPKVAIAHFERALRLGAQEKEVGPLIEVATVASQRQAREHGGTGHGAKNMGVTEGHRRRPDLQEIMTTTGRAAMAFVPKEPKIVEEHRAPVLGGDEDRVNPGDYIERANDLIQQKRLSQSADLLLKAGESAAVNKTEMWQSWTTLGQAFFLAGNYPEAEDAYHQASIFRSETMSSFFNLGLAQQMNGKYMDAVNSYNQADVLGPDNPKVWCNLGAVYFQLGEFKRAEMALRKTLQIKPDYGRAWDNLAASLGAMGQARDAILACREAIKYRPDSADTWFKFGALCFAEGMFGEAIEAFNRSRKDDIFAAQSWSYLSMCYAGIEKPDEAEDSIRKVLALDPKCGLLWMAWNALGLCLYDSGKFDRAVIAYTAATTSQANEPETWFNLGLAHKALGRLDMALRCYVKAIELSPQDSEAWHNLAQIYSEMDHNEEAISAYQNEIQVNPQTLRGWYDMGVCLERVGRADESRAAFARASELQSARAASAQAGPS